MIDYVCAWVLIVRGGGKEIFRFFYRGEDENDKNQTCVDKLCYILIHITCINVVDDKCSDRSMKRNFPPLLKLSYLLPFHIF